jgi:hypothetical protein
MMPYDTVEAADEVLREEYPGALHTALLEQKGAAREGVTDSILIRNCTADIVFPYGTCVVQGGSWRDVVTEVRAWVALNRPGDAQGGEHETEA